MLARILSNFKKLLNISPKLNNEDKKNCDAKTKTKTALYPVGNRTRI